MNIISDASDEGASNARALPAQELVWRLLGNRAQDFDVLIDERAEDVDHFSVKASGGRVALKGTSGVAVASALRHYLAHACRLQITRDSGPALLPARLPDHEFEQRESPWTHRYYLNFCTFSYTTAFWDWNQWEREIDLMALHGVDLPLSLVGNEAVWYSVFKEYGVPERELLAFIGSAAFLPFTWHGSVRNHGGPLTLDWIESHLALGQRIVKRQRSLGMKTVLPGFGGYVPESLASASSFQVEWMGKTNRVLGTTDALYSQVGLALLAEQERLFGSDGYYAIDPFIEGIPEIDADVSRDLHQSAVAQRAGQIVEMLTRHCARNVWVLMSWPFQYRADYWTPERITAALAPVPSKNLLVQDTWAEHAPTWRQTNEFEGRPWLWTMLHNFGGRPGMHAALNVISRAPFQARKDGARTLSGLGIAPESLDHDPVAYELMADATWQDREIELDAWIRTYIHNRYGRTSPSIQEAWAILLREVYTRSDRTGPVRSIVMSRPRVDKGAVPEGLLNMSEEFISNDLSRDLARAWELLLADAASASVNPALSRDLVDVGLEVLTRTADAIHLRLRTHFAVGDVERFERAAARFLQCIDGVDQLAHCYPGYRLSKWLNDAASWAKSDRERKRLIGDAALLVTSWFAPGAPLQDYAGHHWSGLVSGYYRQRWAMWLTALRRALGGQQFEGEAFRDSLAVFETAWQADPVFQEPPNAEPLEISNLLSEWNQDTMDLLASEKI